MCAYKVRHQRDQFRQVLLIRQKQLRHQQVHRVHINPKLLHKLIHVQVGKNHFRAKVQQHRRWHLCLTSFRQEHLAQLQHHAAAPVQTLESGWVVLLLTSAHPLTAIVVLRKIRKITDTPLGGV